MSDINCMIYEMFMNPMSIKDEKTRIAYQNLLAGLIGGNLGRIATFSLGHDTDYSPLTKEIVGGTLGTVAGIGLAHGMAKAQPYYNKYSSKLREYLKKKGLMKHGDLADKNI